MSRRATLRQTYIDDSPQLALDDHAVHGHATTSVLSEKEMCGVSSSINEKDGIMGWNN